jgi:hypothetical protein
VGETSARNNLGEECLAVKYKSKGNYQMVLDVEKFSSLVKVYPDLSNSTIPKEHPIEALEWVKVPGMKLHTYNVLQEILFEHPMFRDHYHPLLTKKEVASRFKVNDDSNKLRRKSRATHDYAIYVYGTCNHHRDARGEKNKGGCLCSSSYLLGFKAHDISLLLGNNGTDSITMHVHVFDDCLHNKAYNRKHMSAKTRVVKRGGLNEKSGRRRNEAASGVDLNMASADKKDSITKHPSSNKRRRPSDSANSIKVRPNFSKLILFDSEKTVNLRFPSGTAVWWNEKSNDDEATYKEGTIGEVFFDCTSRDLLYKVIFKQREGEHIFLVENDLGYAPLCSVFVSPDFAESGVESARDVLDRGGDLLVGTVLCCERVGGDWLYTVSIGDNAGLGFKLMKNIRSGCVWFCQKVGCI